MEQPEREMESTASAARERAEEMAGEARARAEGAKEKVAGGLERAADRLQQRVAAMEPGTTGREALEKVASGVQSTAQYVREMEFRTLGEDTVRYIREHPTNAMLIAASAGFLLGIILSRR